MLQKFSVFQPNAWDNSIVPINILHKIVNNLNEVIDVVNSIEDTGFARAKEYTDSQILIVNERINTISSTLLDTTRRLSALITTVNNLDNRENNHYNFLNDRITAIDNRITEVRAYLKNYTDFEVLQLKNYLENEINEIKKLIDDLLDMPAIDGHTGQFSTVRKIIGVWGVSKNRFIGGNRYALSWGQLSQSSGNGWLARYSNRVYGRINYFAPTWHNLMLNNYDFGAGTSTMYNNNLNTWGCFCNLTLLFLADIVHKINQYCASSTTEIANNYKMVDIYDKTEWDAYVSSGAVIPTYSETDVTGLYDSSNTHVSLIVSQFKLAIGIFTGSVGGYGLYSSSTSVNALFNGSSDLPALIQLLQGNLNIPAYSNTFFNS